MHVDDRLFLQTFGPGGFDVVHAQHVDHLGTHIAGDGTDARNGQYDHRQCHMPQGIQHQFHPAAAETGRSYAADGEDRDLDSKGKDEKQRNDKAGQTVAHNGNDLHELIEHRVLAHGCGNAQRDGDGKSHQHGQGVEHQGVEHRGADNVHNLALVLGGVAKVAGEHIADPDQVLDHQRFVQAQFLAGTVIQSLVGFGFHAVSGCTQHHGDRIAGHGFIDEKHQDGDDKEYKYDIDKSFDQITAFAHWVFPPFPIS